MASSTQLITSASGEQPNLLFIVIDACRPDHMSAYGYGRETTPFLSEFASEALRFEKAFSAAPWTPPSHASMFTGVYPSQHGFVDALMEIDDSYPTLAEQLQEQGYTTRMVTTGPQIGARDDISRGFEHVQETYPLPFLPKTIDEYTTHYRGHLGAFLKAGGRKFLRKAGFDPMNTHSLKTWLIESHLSQLASDDDPFFLFAKYNHPHSPYHHSTDTVSDPEAAADQFEQTLDVDTEKLRQLSSRGGYQYMAEEIVVDRAEWDKITDWYDGNVRCADRQVGLAIEHLRELGIYDETCIIVTADHGEHLGEHGLVGHQYSLYDELIHVPLLIKLPEQQHGGKTHSELVSHVDLLPTVMRGLLDTDPARELPGQSLVPLGSHDREYVFAEYPKNVSAWAALNKYTDGSISEGVRSKLLNQLQCVRSDQFKYIRVEDGADELYDLTADPAESENHLQTDGYDHALVESLRKQIDSTLAVPPSLESIHQYHSSDVVSNLPRFEAEAREKLKELGYL